MTTIGILSAGAMGGALGRAWLQEGSRVVTTVSGRSERTRRLADGLVWLDSVEDVVGAADVVISVVPPSQAVANARRIAQAARRRGVRPVVADLNAIALPRVTEVAALLAEAGCDLVDGSISGPPPGPGTSTRVYLSGPRATEFADWAAPGLRTVVIGSEVGQASAVKMSTAAVYKGLTALMIQALRTAVAYDVAGVVAADWAEELGSLGAQAATQIAVAVAKSDRFPDEMREIAVTQQAAGSGPELYEAIARVFESAYGTRLGAVTPEQAKGISDLAVVIEGLGHPRR